MVSIKHFFLGSSLILLVLFFTFRPALSQPRLTDGETLYVSVYSHVYSGPKLIKFQLSAMLTIRNTDPRESIIVTKVDYYDTKGKKLDSYLNEPKKLGPLETKYFHVKEYDERGGAGANFIVKWHADQPVNAPIIESVMLGTKSGQGISFISPGQVITDNAGK